MSTPLEITVEDYLVSEIEKRGGECLKLEVKGQRGWPDRLCILPEGLTFYVEAKRPKGGRLSIHQIERLDRLRALAQHHAVVKNKIDVDVLMFDVDIMVRARANERKTICWTPTPCPRV